MLKGVTGRRHYPITYTDNDTSIVHSMQAIYNYSRSVAQLKMSAQSNIICPTTCEFCRWTRLIFSMAIHSRESEHSYGVQSTLLDQHRHNWTLVLKLQFLQQPEHAHSIYHTPHTHLQREHAMHNYKSRTNS